MGLRVAMSLRPRGRCGFAILLYEESLLMPRRAHARRQSHFRQTFTIYRCATGRFGFITPRHAASRAEPVECRFIIERELITPPALAAIDTLLQPPPPTSRAAGRLLPTPHAMPSRAAFH